MAGAASASLNAIGLADPIRRFVVQELVSAVLKGNFSTSTIQSWIGKQVDREISEALDGGGPVIVGPWLMEVGFELLYWIPFLRKVLSDHGVTPDRVVAISRGGTQAWYAGLADRYVEIFDLVDQNQFVALCNGMEDDNDGKKPFEPRDAERELCRDAAQRLGLGPFATIFPSSMYKLFRVAWNSRAGGEPILPYLKYRRLDRTALARPPLPFEGNYVAAKYYFSECLPASAANQTYIRDKLIALARSHRVVLLNTGLRLDDHMDAMTLAHDNIFDASGLWTARDNLAVQTALVAHASQLHCTYGGFSYLGPLLGVSTQAVFSHTSFLGTHLDLALRALTTDRTGLAVTSVQADTGLSATA
jgi:hypothetical protein